MSEADEELERFAVVVPSDGRVRSWRSWAHRDDWEGQRVVGWALALAIGAFALVVSVLLGRVDGGVRALARLGERHVEMANRVSTHEYKIVSWCPCGRTLPAGALYPGQFSSSGVPLVDEACDGCFDTFAYATGHSSVRSGFPKTDYDSAQNEPSVHSFVYQMKKHNVSDDVIVTKCGWRKQGTAYYAYGQEELSVRMCVIEEFLNHMASQGWYFSIETWYATAKDMIVFQKYT